MIPPRLLTYWTNAHGDPIREALYRGDTIRDVERTLGIAGFVSVLCATCYVLVAAYIASAPEYTKTRVTLQALSVVLGLAAFTIATICNYTVLSIRRDDRSEFGAALDEVRHELFCSWGRFATLSPAEMMNAADEQLFALAATVRKFETEAPLGASAEGARKVFKSVHAAFTRFSLVDEKWDRYFLGRSKAINLPEAVQSPDDPTE